MKQLSFAICLAVLALTGCKKDDAGDSSTGTPTGGGTSSVPSTFTQKVLLETFTGAGQPQCPDGFVKLDNIVAANSAKAIPVYIHYSDAMEIAQYTTLQSTFANGLAPQFPSGMVNRTPSLSMVIFNRTQWQSNFDVAKVKPAKCGLAISSSISGNTASVTVHSGFNEALTGNYNLTVYLLENNVSGTGSNYDQRNSYNTVTGHAFYGLGDPITGFKHNNVLRKVATAALGDAIASSNVKVGGEDIKTFSIPINGYNSNELYVVAFISKVGTTATDREIMNVQRVKLGSTQNWD